jgi:hypothetical protein
MDGACAAGVRGEVVWVKVARLLDGPRTIVSASGTPEQIIGSG